MVKLTGSKNWIKSSDIKTGDILTILNEGEWQESSKFTYDDGNPVKQFVVRVEFGGEEKDLTMNKVSRTNLSEAWGDETSEWVGKKVVAEKVKVMVGGEVKDTVILSPSTPVKGELPKNKENYDEAPF